MAEVHDDWMSGLGIDIGQLRQAVSSTVEPVADAVSSVASSAVSALAETAQSTVSRGVQTAESVAPAAVETVAAATSDIAVQVQQSGSAAASVASAASGSTATLGATGSTTSSGSPSLKDLGMMAAGGIVHLAAGAVPLGFLGAAAIDTEVAAKGNQEQKFWYGVGSTAAGIADMAVGALEAGGGVLAAPETGGISLAVSAEGVNEMVAGAEGVMAGAALMSGGPGGGSGSGGGTPPAAPRKTEALRAKYKDALEKTDSTDYNEAVDGAETKLKALDKAQDEYEACDTKDPGIIAKKKALDEAEAAAEHSLEDLQREFAARSAVLPGSSKFANGKIFYNQGGGLKSVSAWTDRSGPLQAIQKMESLDDVPVLGRRTDVRGGWWKGAAGHYQVTGSNGGMLGYDVIQSTIDGQELWSWVKSTH
jgi:hypothetical protein